MPRRQRGKEEPIRILLSSGSEKLIRFRRALQRFDPRYISLSSTNAARNGAERGLAISRFPLDFIIELDRVAQKTIEILNPFFPRANLVSFASRLLRLCYDNDVCRFRAPLPSSATPVRSNHRPTFTKKTFSTDNGRDTYGKFMTEPMWKRLDEDYYVDVYTKCVLQFEYNFSKDEWILGVINSDDSRLFYRLLYRFEIRESFNRVVTYRQRIEKSTNSSWRKHE